MWKIMGRWLNQSDKVGTSLVVQWLKLCVPNAGGPSSIPRQGTRSHMLQQKTKTFLMAKLLLKKDSPVTQRVKSLPGMRETWVWSLGWEDPLEKKMATHSSILAWKIPRMENPKDGGLQFIGLQRVGHDWATSLSFFPFFKKIIRYCFFIELCFRWWMFPCVWATSSSSQPILLSIVIWLHWCMFSSHQRTDCANLYKKHILRVSIIAKYQILQQTLGVQHTWVTNSVLPSWLILGKLSNGLNLSCFFYL